VLRFIGFSDAFCRSDVAQKVSERMIEYQGNHRQRQTDYSYLVHQRDYSLAATQPESTSFPHLHSTRFTATSINAEVYAGCP
jgi:hypothetical protein